MSWDTQSRQYFYDMMGGDAGAKNREEQAILHGHELSVPGEQGQTRANRAAVNAWGNRLAGFTDKKIGYSSSMPLPNLDVLDKQALTTASNIGILGNAAVKAAAALEALPEKINSMINGKPSASPSKKSFDIAPGYAIGATPFSYGTAR
jgi:hypothetical protein